jgi:hypothetical protein
VGQVLLQPRKSFTHIATETRAIWLTPLLLLSLTALMTAGAAGWLREQAAASGEIQLPPDFQYYSPEQQAQILQALEATSSPVFLYVFPAFITLTSVWAGWLLTGGLVHLALTMLGGRGEMSKTLNLVAWAGVPYMIRDVIRTGAMLTSSQLVMNPGLSGFITPGAAGSNFFLASFLSLVDAYLIWHIALMVIGAKATSEISTGKAFAGIILSVALILALRAGIASGVSFLGSLTITRPFYF